MPHALPMPSTGLQALILCGPGSSFPTFTSNPDESPKALLPIANRPMVWYPIDFCYRMGITDITLICPPSASKAITSGLGTNPYLSGLPLPRPDVLAPAELDYNTGTADILRLPEIKQLVTGDFIILPCDLICELAGEKLLQAWMVKAASLTEKLGIAKLSNGRQQRHSGGLGVWYDSKASTPVKKEGTDFVALSPTEKSWSTPKGSLLHNVSKLVYSTPTDSLKDLMDDRDGLPVRHGLIKSHPRVRMLTTHRDAHIYIFPRWILEFVDQNEGFESIGEDVVGWWAKAGWQEGLAEKLHINSIFAPKMGKAETDGDSTPISENSLVSPPRSPSSEYQKSRENISFPVDWRRQLEQSELPYDTDTDVPQMLAYIHSGARQTTGSLIRRVDTAQLLLAISLQLAKLPSLEETGSEPASPYAHNRKIAYPEGVKSRTTITKADSLIDNNVTIEEKTAIKECVIGSGCQVNEGAKLQGCLLMEGVVIGKNCKLTRCILGKRCIIGDGSVLTDCEVQENLFVEDKTEDKDNKLMSSEGLEATEAEMNEVLQEQEAAEQI